MPDISVSITDAKKSLETTDLSNTDYPVGLALLAIATAIKQQTAVFKAQLESITVTLNALNERGTEIDDALRNTIGGTPR
jgi:ABC-type transporter Mla subunit MlaD